MRRFAPFGVGLALMLGAGGALAMAGGVLPDADDTVVSAPDLFLEPRLSPSDAVRAGKPGMEEPAETELEKDEWPKTAPEADGAPASAGDTTPPVLEILHPRDGQVFEEKSVVFEGRTEPGARVVAGPYEADVNPDGAWRIVLFLWPGENAVKFVAVDEAGNEAVAKVHPVLALPEPVEDVPKEPAKETAKQSAEQTKEAEKADEEWEPLVAHQLHGSSAETPPFDVFFGTGRPGSMVKVVSEYGWGTTEVGADGEWEVRVAFEKAPLDVPFAVKVKDSLGRVVELEFVRTG